MAFTFVLLVVSSLFVYIRMRMLIFKDGRHISPAVMDAPRHVKLRELFLIVLMSLVLSITVNLVIELIQ